MDCSMKAVGSLRSEDTPAFDYSGNQEKRRVPVGIRHPSQAADIPVQAQDRTPATGGCSPLALSNTRTV
jgi:hypothetical protein